MQRKLVSCTILDICFNSIKNCEKKTEKIWKGSANKMAGEQAIKWIFAMPNALSEA